MSSSPYAPAAKLLNQIWDKRKGLKTVAYNRQGELTCSKATYAQCAHVLQAKLLLDPLCEDIPAKNKGLLYVLMYELLLGPNKSIRGGGALKRQLMDRVNELKESLEQIQKETGEPSSFIPGITIPRYVRVNTTKISTAAVIQILKAKGLNVFLDPHVPDVLVLPPTPESRAQLQDLVTSHQVILQDKSSCFSALCLVHGFEVNETNLVYLDACAAPGNKTSHLAALCVAQQSSNNKIHALDKSSDRFKLLKRRMDELVPSVVQCHNLDFFETSSNNFENVRAILLDPSCSGSGMTSNHLEATMDPLFVNDRVKSLADFQLQALKHATTAFADVTRVVYSTCSMYVEENERVVQRFLHETQGWALVAPKCLVSWTRRGIPVDGLSKEQTETMIRVHPEHDASNGFFVACFEKLTPTKKTKNLVKNMWMGVKSISGISFYNNDFHELSEGVETTTFNDEADKAGCKSLSTKRKAASINVKKIKIQRKDPVTKPKGESINFNEAIEETRNNVSTNVDMKVTQESSKKRAKKLDWKEKQRQRKAERLASSSQKKTEPLSK